MTEPVTTTPPTVPTWPVLTPHERRVLGVLAEKAQTTRDAGPLSLNSLVTGCNQKSNRDPAMNLNDAQAEEALVSAQKKGLAVRITGSGRVERWKHSLYDAWHVSKPELAILTELLLRGSQTEGELRARAGRMEPIADLDTLRGILKPLAERKLVVYLTPEGRRGTTLTHGFHAPEEIERLRGGHGAGFAEVESSTESHRPTRASTGPTQAVETRLDEAHAEITELRSMVTDLQNALSNLEQQVNTIKQNLGIV